MSNPLTGSLNAIVIWSTAVTRGFGVTGVTDAVGFLVSMANLT